MQLWRCLLGAFRQRLPSLFTCDLVVLDALLECAESGHGQTLSRGGLLAPVEFGAGTSRWVWSRQPPAALNPFGTVQGGYLTVFVDELFSTAVASVLEAGEWAMTAEFKIVFLRALSPGPLEATGRVLPPSRPETADPRQ